MQPYRHPLDPVATPGTSADKLLYQDSDGTTPPPSKNLASPYSWLVAQMKLDQAVTLIHKWGPTTTTADSDLVIINGASQAGETVAASTTPDPIRLRPGRNRISITAGGTAPTASYVALELNSFPGVIK